MISFMHRYLNAKLHASGRAEGNIILFIVNLMTLFDVFGEFCNWIQEATEAGRSGIAA
jgi:hypothetical protein